LEIRKDLKIILVSKYEEVWEKLFSQAPSHITQKSEPAVSVA
jgi:hypothetical protein